MEDSYSRHGDGDDPDHARRLCRDSRVPYEVATYDHCINASTETLLPLSGSVSVYLKEPF